MSNCLLNVVAQHLRFYYAVAESVKNSRDVVFIVFAGKQMLFVAALMNKLVPWCAWLVSSALES